ncbi:cylicin-1-like [Bicyclus anynana]|uniref:Cylicin-1-like n=1 Tax=Bicyclus anynana TaxID=110368 RepID=A0A6J1NBJ8_BICAN|nr:cylicin-1-like [Bicyclus anynana]
MNISSIKTNDNDSPKTPGGISKSYLTPCRRVGLSRKWKKGGVSPFISPLSSANSEKESPCSSQNHPSRKRKKICDNEVVEKNIEDESSVEIVDNCNTPKVNVDRTPTRALLLRKKSKCIITPQKCQEEVENIPQSISELIKNVSNDNLPKDTHMKINAVSNITDDENIEKETKKVSKVSKLSRSNSKNSNKLQIVESPMKNITEPIKREEFTETSDIGKNLEGTHNKLDFKSKEVKCPNNLSKECVIVLQRKIFKSIKNTNNDKLLSSKHIKENIQTQKPASQTLFDSDSDDVPLSDFNKTKTDNFIDIKNDNQKDNNTIVEKRTQNKIDKNDCIENIQNTKNLRNVSHCDDDDFIDKKTVNVRKVKKTTCTTGLKIKAKEQPYKTKLQLKQEPKLSSQSSNSIDSDDDFDYSKTKTILIKRTYDKVAKPVKAKSTGSITQKDIDDIKARIESKKTLLLAKAMVNESKELRDLIKKWRLGCQKALMDLLDLMKVKLEKNVEYSELLDMLNIPPDLVGYNSDNDCFNTPDDASVILSALKID